MPNIELAVVLSNKKNAYALQRAREQGYKGICVKTKNRTSEEFDQKLIQLLEKYKVDLVVLIGFMRILGPKFIEKFPNKIINVHPSLIPKYCGKDFHDTNVHKAVLEAGDRETGMTIHYVDKGIDTGPIILKKTCPVFSDDTPETLKARVQDLEKKWYPEVIRQITKKSP
jgi:phosphoribosylglycinamide formyltransferase-1